MSRKKHSKGGRASQVPAVGNPVARSPLMRKGGAHRQSASGERVRARLSTRAALEDWLDERDERDEDEWIENENGELRLPVVVSACRKKVAFSRQRILCA